LAEHSNGLAVGTIDVLFNAGCGVRSASERRVHRSYFFAWNRCDGVGRNNHRSPDEYGLVRLDGGATACVDSNQRADGRRNQHTGRSVLPNVSASARSAVVIVSGAALNVSQLPNMGNQRPAICAVALLRCFWTAARGEQNQLSPQQRRESCGHGEEFPFLSRVQLWRPFAVGAYIGLLDRDPEYSGWLFQRQVLAESAAVSAGTRE
jgi:hypothetical protein